MTLLEIERLNRRIAELLQSGGHPDAAPRLAEEFANICHAANLRLQQCESMIRANDRLQAIQLAESAPNLLDLIALLESPAAVEWRAFCQKNALPVAERIDARAVQVLNECYRQGISTDHPLYAAYRKATLTRNDTEALNALRSIARLNPSDANAAGELARMDAKVLAARVEHLATLLNGGDAAQVVGEIESIESFGFKTKPDGDIWRKAALVRCSVLIQEASKAQVAVQWKVTLSKIELVRRLQKELDLKLPAGELQQLAELEKWTQAEQEKDRLNREFAALLTELQRQIQKSEEKDTSARYVELPELRADYEALHKVWRALTDFTRPIPEDASAAFRKRSGLLEAEISRRMAVRRRAILAGAAAVLLIGAALIWLVLGQMKAHQFARDLRTSIAQRQTRVAEHLIDTARADKPLLHSGNVSAAVADTESFLAKEHSLLTNFNNSFTGLPTQLTGAADAAHVNAIARQLSETHAALNALSPDLKTENEPRVAQFDRQWQQYLAEAAGPVNEEFEQSVAAAEKLSARLDYRAPTETAAQLAALSGPVQKMNSYETDFKNIMPLRSDLLQRASAVQARFDAFHREWQKLEDGFASLKQARTFADYSGAISAMASSEFSSAPAAAAANNIRSLNPGEEIMLRSLLNATNPATWAFIKKGKSPTLMPEAVMPVEATLYLQLRDDPALNADHERYRFWLDSDGSRYQEWITSGTLDGSLGWKKIRAWTVEAGATHAVFSDHDYGFFNGQWKLSARETVSRLERLPQPADTAPFQKLDKVWTWIGEDRYNQPLLQVVDAVKKLSEGSPICRAYLICQFVKIMEFQPDDWGLTFCPSIRADVARIRSTVGGDISSGDWFVPSKIEAWSDKLDKVFSTEKTSSYQKEAEANLLLAQAAARDGLQFIGFAGLDGKPVFTTAQTPTEVWGYDAATKQPALVHDAALPLSPLFALPLSRAEYLARAGVDPASPIVADANALLPLFRANH
jgi:hypothetical protein